MSNPKEVLDEQWPARGVVEALNEAVKRGEITAEEAVKQLAADYERHYGRLPLRIRFRLAMMPPWFNRWVTSSDTRIKRLLRGA